jgi:hypothetical protein
MLIKMVIKKVNRIICVSVVADNFYIATNLIKVTRSEVKRQCLKMSVNGMGFRAIERIKGVHHTSIINWVKQVGELLPDGDQTRHDSPGGRT